jgi:hypothetical protein
LKPSLTLHDAIDVEAEERGKERTRKNVRALETRAERKVPARQDTPNAKSGNAKCGGGTLSRDSDTGQGPRHVLPLAGLGPCPFHFKGGTAPLLQGNQSPNCHLNFVELSHCCNAVVRQTVI